MLLDILFISGIVALAAATLFLLVKTGLLEKTTPKQRFALRQLAIAVLTWVVTTLTSPVEWDKGLVIGLVVTLSTAALGLLNPVTDPFVGLQGGRPEVPMPPADPEPNPNGDAEGTLYPGGRPYQPPDSR